MAWRRSAGSGRRPQVAVDRLAADPELPGQRGLLLAGGGARTQLLRLLDGERGLATGAHAALLGHGDSFTLAFQDQGALGYDRARSLLDTYTRTKTSPGWDLHQLRHSAATHLGDANAGLQLIMAKGRWRNPRTAMRYVRPGAVALAEVTELLDITPPRRG